MVSFQRIQEILWGRTENLFLGTYFLLFKRFYTASFGRFAVPRSWTRAHFYARFLNNSYEEEERRLISKYLAEDDHVLELGACAGIVSCLTATKIRAGRHCVVEANPHLLSYLYENRLRNSAGFQILGAAVSESKELTFYLNKNMVGGSAERRTSQPCQVIGVPLKWVEERFGPFNTLVMDIEGGEKAFFEAYHGHLNAYKKLFIEFHPSIIGTEAVAQLKANLADRGFTCVESIGDVDFWLREPGSPENN